MRDVLNFRVVLVLFVAVALGALAALQGAELVKSKDGTVVGFKDTPRLPWDPRYHTHDPDRPWPKEVTPGPPTSPEPPSDAGVLFDGTDLSAWRPNKWKLTTAQPASTERGRGPGKYLVATEGDLVTKKAFGDCQLHLEWRAPDPPQGPQMNRGNSGVFFMRRYEVQIFDSHTEKIYADGIAGAIYGETPPMVHPLRPPGRWNSYDIVFTAPEFEGDEVEKPARVTMLFNGVLVHLNTEIHGPLAYRRIAPYEPHPDRQPLHLQAHGNPVQFRNIWIRPLDLEGDR